jgi:hypothetical protein
MSDTPRVDAALCRLARAGNVVVDLVPFGEIVPAELARQLERELNDLRTDAARYRAIRGLLVGVKWSDTGVMFYSAACPGDEKYVKADGFDQMADKLCEDP